MNTESASSSSSSSQASSEGSRCGACGGDTRSDIARPASTYAPRGEYAIATCNRCGSGRTVPIPQPEELDAFYSKEYSYDSHILIAAEKRWRARNILDVALPSNASSVLDVGCMYGYLLKEASKRGIRDAAGVELSSGPAKAAVADGLDVFCGSIEAFAEKTENKDRRFDLVVAQHVLEHVPDPVGFLKTARSLLKPNGKVCICVPNYDARARKVFREAWGWYQVPVHLHHFGEQGLSSVLGDAGFTIDKTVRRGGDSLFVMMTLLQSIGKMPSSSDTKAPSAFGRALVRTASALLRPYYFVGDDELLVVASAK